MATIFRQWISKARRIFYSEWFFFGCTSVVVLILWIITPFVVAYFVNPFDQRGIAGDLYGALNALFTGLAFAGLITTLIMQKRELALQRAELKETRKEMSNQRGEMALQNKQIKLQIFESAFFQMVAVLNRFIEDISGTRSSRVYTGRDCLKMRQQDLILQMNRLCERPADLVTTYEAWYLKYQNDLGPYFRILYNIVKFIDESDIDNKSLYSNIVRAQLSESELIVLAFNVGSPRGEKFRQLSNRFHLLKHCPNQNSNVDIDHLRSQLTAGYLGS